MRSGIIVHEDEGRADGASVGSDDGVEDLIPMPDPIHHAVLEDVQLRFVLHTDPAPHHDGATPVAVMLGDIWEVKRFVATSPHSPSSVSHVKTEPRLIGEEHGL